MNIAHIGDAVLKQKAQNVTNALDADIQTLIDKMFDTMSKEKGVGLAAPQVNVSQQIAVIDTDKEKLTLINPEITHRSEDLVLFTEGCLSVPDKELLIIRHEKITVQYIDRNNQKRILNAKGFLAIVCQHEIDHLNGILMTDRFKQQQPLRQTLNINEKV